MEETFARVLQFTLAGLGAFTIALWFALSVWTFRDIERRTASVAVQILATLVVVLGFIPGVAIYLLLRPRETLDETYEREVEESYLLQELEAVPSCPRCSRVVHEEYQFCPECGATLRHSCGKCGRLAEVGWKVCAYCGNGLRSRPPSAHRRRATGNSQAASQQWEVELDVDSESAGLGSGRRVAAAESQGQDGLR